MKMMPMRRSVVVGMCLAFVIGCGDSGAGPNQKTYPVSGSVAYKGEPVVGATVTFMCEDAAKPATGITDKEGKFKLSTFAVNDGAVAGEHKITVVKDDGPKGPTTVDTTAMNDPGKMAEQYTKQKDANALAQGKSALPAKYASQATTPLKETVKADGANQFVLQLAEDAKAE